MISKHSRAKLLSQILIYGAISTGMGLLSIESALAANVIFKFSTDSTGTAPFDANNAAGNDSSATNAIVRTQDIITYKWEYNVSNGDISNVVFQATVPDNVQLVLPAACGAGSQITTNAATGSQSVQCQMGTILSGSAGRIDLKARVLPQRRSPSNAYVANLDVTNAVGSITGGNIATVINPITVSNLTISAAPKADLFKKSALVEGLVKDPSGENGLVIVYPIAIALTGSGKGGEALVGDLTFTDSLVYNGGASSGLNIPGAKLYTWRPGYTSSITPGSTSGCNRIGGDQWATFNGYPNGKINSGFTSAYTTPERSTTDSGTWTCTQATPGGPIQVTISGADTTGNLFPTKSFNGTTTLPANEIYLVSGVIRLWVPLTLIEAAGGTLNVRNQLSSLGAIGASTQPNLEPTQSNNGHNHTLVSVSGTFTSFYAKDIDNRGAPLIGMSGLHSGDGPVMPSQVYAGRITLVNNGVIDWSPGSIACTAIDNSTQEVLPIAGTPASAIKDYNSSTSLVLGTDYVFEYGTGNYATAADQKTATCRDQDSPSGWFTDIRNVPGGNDAVTKIRVRAINPIPSAQQWNFGINLRARNNYLGTTTQIPIGTRLVEHSSYYLAGSTTTNPGMPTGWRGGSYDVDANTNIAFGDRLTFTRAIVRIDKQNVPNNPSINAQVGTEVTFVLRPTITATVNPPPVVSSNVIVRDILPATMNYVAGSANILPTSIVTNGDGTKTIIWDLGPRIPGQVIPDITYRASIRLDTPNNSSTVNTAIVESPDDGSVAADRTDIATINVGNAASFRIFKEVNKAIIERDQSITYDLLYANTGVSDLGTSRFIDILPYSGDGRTPATAYTGTIAFNSIAGTNGETFEFTNRPPTQISPDPDNVSNLTGGTTTWCLVSQFNTPGCPTANSNVTGIRINALAFLKGQPTRKVTINMTTAGNNPNDIYTNRFTGLTNGLLGLSISNDVFTRVRIPTKVLAVKRITAINTTNIVTVVDDPTTNDNHAYWPANYLKGAIDGVKVGPGDELEYTIYFLNTGDNSAKDVKICDLLQPNQTFLVDKYGTGAGIQLKLGSNAIVPLTNIADGVDRAQVIPAGTVPPASCNLPSGATNADGTISVDLTGANGTGAPALVKMPGATAPGTPNDAYGFIRFRTKVK